MIHHIPVRPRLKPSRYLGMYSTLARAAARARAEVLLELELEDLELGLVRQAVVPLEYEVEDVLRREVRRHDHAELLAAACHAGLVRRVLVAEHGLGHGVVDADERLARLVE